MKSVITAFSPMSSNWFPHETNLWHFLCGKQSLPFLHNRKETFSTALRDMCTHFRENYLCLVSHRGKMYCTCGISLRGCRQHFRNVWLLWLPGKKSPVIGMGQIGHGDPLRNNRISSPCFGVRWNNYNDMAENEFRSLEWI